MGISFIHSRQSLTKYDFVLADGRGWRGDGVLPSGPAGGRYWAIDLPCFTKI